MPVGKKRKSRSEILNEQFDDGADGAFDPEANGYADGPMAEDYFEGDGGDDEWDEGLPAKAKKKESPLSAKKARASKKEVLRRRAPLDPSFEEGEYAAERADASTINAKVDSLFSMFDGDGLGGEEGGDFGDDEEDEENEMGDGKAITNEEDYAAFYEKKMEQRVKRQAQTGSAGDDELLNQIEELRERQINITGGDGDDEEEGDDDVARAELALKDITQVLVKAYGQLVQLRVKLESGVSKAVRAPQYYSRDFFIENDSSNKLGPNYTAASEALWAVAEDLLSCSDVEGGAKQAKKREGSLKALYQSISNYHTAAMRDVDACITHWSSKMATNYNPKHQAINRPLLEQIRGVISGKARLLAKAQRNRLHEAVYGHPAHFNATKQQRALAIADGDNDAEIFDDSDFLRELIHRSGALAQKLQESVDTLKAELQADQPKPKQGFHQKTKGKAVNYEPRPKLVGFMVPEPFAEGNAHETLLASLFQ